MLKDYKKILFFCFVILILLTVSSASFAHDFDNSTNEVNSIDIQDMANYEISVTENSNQQTGDYYVSQDGSDENDGSKDHPFATVDKAIKSNTGGKTVIVNKGTYAVNGIYITNNITIIGVGDVTFDAQNKSNHFSVSKSIILVNINFINGKYTSGASSISGTSTSGVSGNSDKYITITNCTFKDNYGMSVIRSYANTNITHCKFVNNTIIGATSFSTGSIHVKDNNINVNYCSFVGNKVTNSKGVSGIDVDITIEEEDDDWWDDDYDDYDNEDTETITYAVNIDYNYWDCLGKPSNKELYIKDGFTVDLNNWIVPTVDVPANVVFDSEYDCKLVLKSTNGTNFNDLKETMPSINFTLNSSLGSSITPDELEVNNVTKFKYLANNYGNEVITINSNGKRVNEANFVVGIPEIDKIYVSPSGSNSNIGTYDKPLKTIAAAIDKVKDGKTIIILKGTYNEYDLEINKNINIIGVDAIIDAEENGRIFVIKANVNIFNITFSNALADAYDDYNGYGGAILLDSGILNIYDSKFENSKANVGGAIANNGMATGILNVYNCTFTENGLIDGIELYGGSAIYSNGKLLIVNSTFNNNDASTDYDELDGTVYIVDSADVINSTFTNNNANKGGAIYIDAYNTATINITNNNFVSNKGTEGGAIYSSLAKIVTINNNTFKSNNNAIVLSGRGATNNITNNKFINNTNYAINLKSSSSAYLKNNTMQGNGKMIMVASSTVGPVNITYLENNTIKAKDGLIELGATVTDDMGNPINGGKLIFTANGNQFAEVNVVNGQATTKYQFNTGNYVISGSYLGSNSNYPANIKTGLLRINVPNYWFINETGYETLQEAVDVAGFNDVIKGVPGTYIVDEVMVGHRYRPSEPYTINKTITITSLNETPVILKGNNDRVLNLDYYSSLTVRNIIFANTSYANGYGSAIHSMGKNNLTIDNCTFIGNIAEYGGAIYAYGNLTINNTKFINNSASVYAGAIYKSGDGFFKINSTKFINNSAYTYGGAIYVDSYSSEKCLFENTLFKENVANSGGALFTNIVPVTFNNVDFIKNKAVNTGSGYDAIGGAIFTHSENILNNCNFINNSAEERGGAMELDNSVFYIVSADGREEYIRWVVMNNCSFINNTSPDGGALYMGYESVPHVNITESLFKNNNGQNAVISNNYGILSINKTQFVSNYAENLISGKGLYNYLSGSYYYASTGIIDSTFENNNVTNDIYLANEFANLEMNNTTFNENNRVLYNNLGFANLTNNKINVNKNISAIYNIGTLDLGDNTINSICVPIYNKGEIISPTYIVVMDNKTVKAKDNTNYLLTAVVLDDNNNMIEGSDLVFKVNDKELNAINNNGIFTANYTITRGEQIVNADYDNGLTDLTVKTGVINGFLDNSTINILVESGFEDDPVVVNIVVSPNNATGNVTVVIDGKKYNVTLQGGNASLVVTGLKAGNHNITAIYNGDENYNSSSLNSTFTITAVKKVIIDSKNITLFYRNGTAFEITLLDSNHNILANRVVSFEINGCVYNKTTDEKGMAKLTINLNSGEYIINTYFKGDENYTSANANNSITVLSSILGNDVVKYFCNGTQYSAKFFNHDGSVLVNTNVSFNINGILYHKTTDENGIATLNINLNSGEYILTAINPITGEMDSNKVTVLSTILGNDVVKYFCNGTQYSAKFFNHDGSVLANTNVSFNINGILYHKTTDENGIATLNINLNPGTYILTAINHVTGEMGSNEITVLPVLTGKDLNMKYNDGSKYEVQLVNGVGNPVSGAEITMNINGVFYYKITNDNGTAYLNINLNPGKYIITSRYDNAAVSNKITIIK